MPKATPSTGPSLVDNLDELLENLNPNKGVSKSTSSKKEMDAAKRVRDTFLSYRKQLNAVTDILQRNTDQSSDTLSTLAQEANGMLLVLDQLDKRKRITADTLLNFVTQLNRMSSEVHRLKQEKSKAAEELNEKDPLENPHMLRLRFQELAVHIGENVNSFIAKNSDRISQAGGLSVKAVLMGILGPGAPIVALLDQVVDIDKRVGQLLGFSNKLLAGAAKMTFRAGKGAVTSTLGAAKVTADAVATAMKSVFGAMLPSPREKGKGLRERLLEISLLKRIHAGINRVARDGGSFVGVLLSGLSTLMGGLLTKLGVLFAPLLGAVAGLSTLTLGGFVSALVPPLVAGLGAYLLGKNVNEKLKGAKNKDFFDGGLQSRSAQYGKSAAGFAAAGGLLAGPPGFAAGGLIGLGYAGYQDDLGGRVIRGARDGVSTGLNFDRNKKYLLEAAKLTGVDPKLLGIKGFVESRFDEKARAPTGTASGLLQVNDETWKTLLKRYADGGTEGRRHGISMNAKQSDPRANAILAAELMKENNARLSQQGTPINASTSYLAHFLGSSDAATFFRNLKTNGNAPAAPTLFRAANENPNLFFTGEGANRRALSYAEIYANTQTLTSKGARYGDQLAKDARLQSFQPGESPYTPNRLNERLSPEYRSGPAAPASAAAAAAESPKSTVNSVPFMPDDNSLMMINIVGLIG